MTIAVTGIDHVVLRVRDAERAIRFYCDVLGCTVERRRDDLGLIHLRAGHSQIDIVPVDGPLGSKGGPPPGGDGHNVDHVCLALEHFDEAAIRAHLGSHGVEPGEAATRFGAAGDGPSMYIRDPDGNTVELKGPPDG